MDIGSINMDEIEKIMSSLSQQDMEMLGSMANQFFSSGNSTDKEKTEKKNEGEKNKSSEKGAFPPFSDIPIDFETLNKIYSIMNKLNSQPADKRCEFLLSLKPMLSQHRRQKVDSAISMLRIMSLLPLLNELG